MTELSDKLEVAFGGKASDEELGITKETTLKTQHTKGPNEPQKERAVGLGFMDPEQIREMIEKREAYITYIFGKEIIHLEPMAYNTLYNLSQGNPRVALRAFEILSSKIMYKTKGQYPPYTLTAYTIRRSGLVYNAPDEDGKQELLTPEQAAAWQKQFWY